MQYQPAAHHNAGSLSTADPAYITPSRETHTAFATPTFTTHPAYTVTGTTVVRISMPNIYLICSVYNTADTISTAASLEAHP
jgi:hypothetical protein